jgi:asparagine synthase (glutamine-hydrolysing)
MCGFAGFLAPNGLDRDAHAIARAMADRLAHRGPDDAGTWLDHEAGIALAHRRLSIVDLSPAGAQPMRSAGGRYVIVFNGEIYDHLALREALGDAGGPWRGHSDTETLLAAIERWGVREALERCVGMFAFALWDTLDRRLVLARDRLGEKPCYYGWSRGALAFGSELKALRALPGYDATPDPEVLALYLRYGYVPAPHAIHRGVVKLPPGCIVQWPRGSTVGTMPEPEPYWTLREVAEAGIADPFGGDEGAAVDELERLLHQSIALQRVADVPLGAFLSGGIDSSTVVALMQAQASSPVRTFTMGFAEDGYDESAHARAVARHLGTDHTELTVTPEEGMAALTRIPGIYDEPYGDASAIPTMLLAALARRDVTVSLSGDGGDELFAGYGRYHRVEQVWRQIRRVPPPLRLAAAAALRMVPARELGAALGRVRPGGLAHLLPQRVRSLQIALRAESVLEPYREVMSLWTDPADLLEGDVREPPSALTDPAMRLGAGHSIDEMAYADGVSYLPDDVLVKVDRAAMAVSLETRVPLLDHRVVAFAWSLPQSLKTRNGTSKWVLRRVLDRYVPAELIERPKMGFGVPMDRWLRGPLREWAEDLLSPERLRSDGYLRPEPVRAAWEAHLAGTADWQYHLWPVLALQAWLDEERGS